MGQQEQSKESEPSRRQVLGAAGALAAAALAGLKTPALAADSNAGADAWFDAKMAERVYSEGGFAGGPGVSAHTIYHTLRGQGRREDPAYWPSHPYDEYDFGRCVELLDAAPAWRSRIGEMKQVSHPWAKLAESWETIEREFHAGRKAEVRRLIELAITS